MRLLRDTTPSRRGIAALFFGLMLPVFIGFVALSIDLSVVAVARSQLSTAADAAALAGARKLADDYRIRGITDLTSEISAANASSLQFAQANAALGRSIVMVQNPDNATTGDIVVGYLNPNNINAALDTSLASQSLFNAVQVTTSRNSNHDGMVPSYFSRMMGFQGSSVSVSSTAIAQNFSIAGYKSSAGLNVNLLPIVLDVTTYQAMMNGTTSDQYTWNPSSKTVTSGPDGVEESKLYPVSNGSPGNWGTINVGVSNNSTSVLGAQIRNGITPAQLATFPNSTIALDNTLSPPQITFSGNPGISAGIKDDLVSIIGKPVSIPIYDTNGGNGNNAWYRVIAFAPVRILSVNFQGSNKYVIVQPALIDDSSAIRGTVQSSWSSGGLIVTYLAR